MNTMKTIKEYEAMTVSEQGTFLAHAAAELVQKMYYDNNNKGLETFCKLMSAIQERARNCIDCLTMLQREGDVYAKIYLLLEYMGKNGVDEEFVTGLTEIAEKAQESLAMNTGAILNEDEEQEVMKTLRDTMNRHEISANKELRNSSPTPTPQKTTITQGTTKIQNATNTAANPAA